MNVYEENLEGREFDWFAIDMDGNIALFSTAGEGTVPAAVINSFAEHDNISQLLDSPNWGSSDVWSDYAALGFYVYDWNLHGGPYQREREPSKSMSRGLGYKLRKMRSLHHMPVMFAENTEIDEV